MNNDADRSDGVIQPDPDWSGGAVAQGAEVVQPDPDFGGGAAQPDSDADGDAVIQPDPDWTGGAVKQPGPGEVAGG